MGKLEKATDFYLRGFNSQYIKRRTDISMQSLLKQLLSKGIKYTKDDIFKYQVQYIQNHFTIDEIRQEYINLIANTTDPSNAKRGRNIVCLGCGFGDYVRVFKSLLGEDQYKRLRNECWHQKQMKTMQRVYGTDNVFRKETFSQFVSNEAVLEGRRKRTDTLIERYGVEHPNQNPIIVQKMVKKYKETNVERYGVEHPMQRKEIAQKVSEKRQNTMLEKYGAKNSVQNKKIRNRIFESRKRNGTLNTSKPEEYLYVLLVEKFGKEDIYQNTIVDNRYPYHVDYYIKSLDLFIEFNGDKSHNDHWFDKTDEQDIQIVNAWKENMLRIESETGKISKYQKYIKTWTQTDVEKRKCAKKNNLNYLVFWDGSCSQKQKKQIPNLKDAYLWFEAGCPMPQNWNKSNTY